MTAASVVRERPILFSGAMVRAILAGQKTQTRRVAMHTVCGVRLARLGCDAAPDVATSPFGQPGDRLWVRETWSAWSVVGAGDLWRFRFAADGAERTIPIPAESDWLPPSCLARQNANAPSIFLPRWASRLTLEITAVRVERLQEIAEADAIAEGMTCAQNSATCGIAREHYHDLWDSLNEKRGYGWDVNPWVWVLEVALVQS